jgi:hypothetical protein
MAGGIVVTWLSKVTICPSCKVILVPSFSSTSPLGWTVMPSESFISFCTR